MTHVLPVDTSHVPGPPRRPPHSLLNSTPSSTPAPINRSRHPVPLRLQTDIRIPCTRPSPHLAIQDASRTNPQAREPRLLTQQTRVSPSHIYTQSLPMPGSPEMIELKHHKRWQAWTVPGVGLSPACLLERKLDEVGIMLHESDGENGGRRQTPEEHVMSLENEALEDSPEKHDSERPDIRARIKVKDRALGDMRRWHTEPMIPQHCKHERYPIQPHSLSPIHRQQLFWQNVFQEPSPAAIAPQLIIPLPDPIPDAKPKEELDYFSLQPHTKQAAQIPRIPPLPFSSSKSSPSSGNNSATSAFSTQSPLAFFGQFLAAASVLGSAEVKSSTASPQEGWWDVLKSPFFVVTPVSVVVTPGGVSVSSPGRKREEDVQEVGPQRPRCEISLPSQEVKHDIAEDLPAISHPHKPPPLPPRAATTIPQPPAASHAAVPAHNQQNPRRPPPQSQHSAPAAPVLSSSAPSPPHHHHLPSSFSSPSHLSTPSPSAFS